MYVSNGIPVVIKNVPIVSDWDTPLWEARLGRNKTIRGLVSGIFAAMLTGWLLHLAWSSGIGFFTTNVYLAGVGSAWHAILIGGIMGLGALFGDAFKSYWKRRLSIPSGAPWIPWDGVDYILGTFLFLSPFFVPTPVQIIFLLILSPLLSAVSNVTSYLIGWKNVPY